MPKTYYTEVGWREATIPEVGYRDWPAGTVFKEVEADSVDSGSGWVRP